MTTGSPSPSRTRWTAVQRTCFAALTVGLAAYVVWMDARPTAVFFGAAVVLLVAFGVELRRVEFAHWLTITFGNRRSPTDRGSDEDDDE